MARQSIQPNPSVKLFEAYNDFSGGLNTETSNERLRDNEFPVLQNVDLSGRGSARRRSGRVEAVTAYPVTFTGTEFGQGAFFYYRADTTEPDIVLAINGRLYIRETGTTILKTVKITDGANADFTFQATKRIEAVQYKKDMFIATGTKLVELTHDNTKTDKWIAKVVTPYTPSVMEVIYIGTNGLADNPDAYVADGQGAFEVTGIKPAARTGSVNNKVTMTAYINKPTTITAVSYKWEYKKSADSTWTLGRDWTADTAGGKSYDFKVDTATKWDVRVTVKDISTSPVTATPQYVMSAYTVNPVDNSNATLPVSGIQKCRKIILHWDRLIMSGDDTNPYQVYVSDLNNPRFFPVTNAISFDTGKQEPITALLRYRDFLIVFTRTTIQTLVGKSVEDYRRSVINESIGCVAGRTAKVIGNNVAFLSDEGVFVLKPNQFVLESMNVSRIDHQVKQEIPRDTVACAIVTDNQYFIAFPTQTKLYRFYYDTNTWVRDASSKLNISQFLQYGEDVYNFTTNGHLYKHDSSVYADCGEVYDMVVESKFFDLSATFNFKKLKRMYILGRHYPDHNVDLRVKVLADSAYVLTPETGEAYVTEDGYTEWRIDSQPNMHFYTGTTIGTWVMGSQPLGNVLLSVQKASVRGKCRRVKVIFNHTQDAPCELYGFGLEFKMKKV